MVTGGANYSDPVGAVSRVSRYNRAGWVEDLPNMGTRRYDHGCSSLLINEKKVEAKQYILHIKSIEHFDWKTKRRPSLLWVVRGGMEQLPAQKYTRWERRHGKLWLLFPLRFPVWLE